MTPEATLWAEAQQVPLVPCRGEATHVARFGPDQHCRLEALDGTDEWRAQCCGGCSGTGEVRSDVYRAIERAITEPCNHRKYRIDVLSSVTLDDGRACSNCGTEWAEGLLPSQVPTGRVVRPQPGVMACPSTLCHVGKVQIAGSGLGDVEIDCDLCGGSGTVPDPSEAGVVARDEACGRLMPVKRELLEVFKANPADTELMERLIQLTDALGDSDYPGAIAATLEGVQALAAVA